MEKKSIALSTTIVSWTRKLSLLLLFVGYLTYPSKIQAQEAEIVKATVENEQVKIRVRVESENEQPVTHIQRGDFKVVVDGNEIKRIKSWKNPEEAEQPSAWIIFLLDMSGSMAKPDRPGSNQTKLEGAIQAIQEFTEATANRSSDTQVAIVPFGEANSKSCGYVVNEEALNNFFLVGNPNLQNYLQELARQTPCAATNIYDPLTEAVKFLSKERGDSRFYPQKEFFWQPQPQQPRLSIILLSDGHHNQSNEEQDFKRLKGLLENNNNIIVHSLGYGLKPKELAQKYNLFKSEATRGDISYGPRDELPPGQVPAEEFVDRDRLDEIAKTTGGMCKISGNAEEVGNSLRVFLDALLGEYEITYTDPNPIRAERHEVLVKVAENVQHLPPEGLESDAVPYRITSFGWSLPFPAILAMFVGVFLIMGIGGILPFYFWGEHLKREALED